MVEMELKAVVKNKADVEKKLKNLGCEWCDEGEQIDSIYLKDEINKISSPVFRIRKSKSKHFLTFKILEENVNTAKEFETQILDEQVFIEIIRLLGFHFYVTVKKQRKTTSYNGYTICLDEVEQLGTFIEIEKLSDSCQNEKEIYTQQRKILSLLGIEEQMLVNEKYYQMLMNK